MNITKKIKSIQGNKIEVFKTSNWKDYYTPKASSDGCHIIYDAEIPDDMENIELFLPVSKDFNIGRIFVVTVDKIYSSYGILPKIHIHQKVKGITQYVTRDPMSMSYNRSMMSFMWGGIYAGWMPVLSEGRTSNINDENYFDGSWAEGNGSGDGGIGLSLLG